jgi:hypothetical protein
LSVDVLIVPEDFTYNGYILGPLVKRMLSECGRSNANVSPPKGPQPKGYEHAKSLLRNRYFELYRHMSLLLFLPDFDGKGESRNDELRALEREAAQQGARLLCCAAKEEVEVWLLAGHRDRLGQSWQEVRSDTSVKENVFQPFLAVHGNPKAPGGGRDLLMERTLNGYSALLRLCPELADLERRIQEALG